MAWAYILHGDSGRHYIGSTTSLRSPLRYELRLGEPERRAKAAAPWREARRRAKTSDTL